ncbi:MAG TPA: aspartate aminotransferase [Lentisphaeria bacterium]|nr:MAG: aspartate aminotransferase [Lentisphaerae bacterium GWF2_49_21]HBC85866.1 aspartate aminotransferase [Lentisphaeria bacterium]
MKELKTSKGTMGSLELSATLSITAKAKAMKAAGDDVLSLCAGEPDFDTPDHIKNAAIEALKRGETKYTPESGRPDLKEACAEKLMKENNIPSSPAQIVVGPGAKFSIFTAIAALCGPGDEVILGSPYWVSYPEMIKASGAKPVIIPCRAEDNYELNPDQLSAAVNQNTKLLILNSPSNPTGAVYRKETLEKIANLAASRNFMILSDEIYEKLTYDPKFPHASIASFSQEIADLTITVNGFSKAYSMTGWRLGYLSAPKWLTDRICALQSNTTSNPTTFAQFGAIAALKGDQTCVETMRQAFSKRRDLIYGLMSAIPGVKCIRPQGAFYIFCDISSFGLNSWDFSGKLLSETKTAVIPGQPFGAEGHIRLSYACSDQTIQKSVERIRNFCSGLK